MRYSAVTSLYNMAPYLRMFHARMTTTLRHLMADYEIVYVNDASTDDCKEILEEIAENDAHVRVIDLAKNIGQHAAIKTGLAAANGDRVFLIDADLEEAPELLLRFADAMDKESVELVYGHYEKSARGPINTIGSSLYYTALQTMVGAKFPRNQLMARLLSRTTANAMLAFGKNDAPIAMLCALSCSSFVVLPCEKTYKGNTTYTFAKKWRLFQATMTEARRLRRTKHATLS